MKKILPIIAGIALGGLFIMASVPVLLNLKFAQPPPLPEGSPIAHFMAATWTTGYIKFVKIFELVGGIIVIIPRLRSIGLLLLGPVIVNIVACHIFLMGDNMKDGMAITALVLALYLLWVERRKWAGLVK